MKILCKIIFLFIFLTVIAEAQTFTWSKWYDYDNLENAGEDIEQTFDGGYIILGNIYETLNYFSVLIKTDKFGNIQWQRVLDYSTTNDFLSCFEVHQTKDSGFTISGHGNDSAVLLKTDQNGEVIWLKKYGVQGFLAQFRNHENTSDGGLIAGGRIYSLSNQIYIVKTDSLGNIQWSNTSELFTSINSIIQSNDGSYYFTGVNRITKLDPFGNHVWSRVISKIGSDLIELSSYTLLLAGSNPQMYLTKVDTSGTVLWQRSYFPDAACLSMIQSKDNNILLSGFKETLGTAYTAVAKADTSGNEIFTKTIISAPSNYYFISWAVGSTSDSGFIITGRCDFPGPPYQDNIYVIKTDSSCNAPEIVGINNQNSSTPGEFVLHQNYPNPFNPVTNIEYDISKPGNVKLSVYSIIGEEITTLINSYQSIGNYKVEFNADNFGLSSGLYFIKLSFNNNTNLTSKDLSKIIKMIYLK